MNMGMVQTANGQRKGFMVAALLGLLALGLAGCSSWHQPGETAADRSLRHDRVLRHNYQLMAEDIDKVLLLDKPSRLGDHSIP